MGVSAAHLLFCEKEAKMENESQEANHIAIYHLEAKVISRGAGRSAVAAAAYMSCSRIYNDYDGIQHDYTRKGGLVWQSVFLPEHAPAEWQDRSVLWNAVEETEKTKDSRLAREFVAALPIELDRHAWRQLLTDFVRAQFVSDGMCADVAIHDTDGHNPHAHILLTVRPLDEQGKWQYKTEKEYLCVKNGEERGFTAAEFKSAQAEGWEKQYQYKVGRKKVYMPPSEAEKQGLERASKHPKSTKYGRQNPISERWNSEEQLTRWRKAWADMTNLCLEQAASVERIDHRSHAERGIDEQPTIHEGVEARAIEQKGILSERCELNRQIKADNILLRELKSTVKHLARTVRNTLPAIAEAMETTRRNLLIFGYQLRHIRKSREAAKSYLASVTPGLERCAKLFTRIKEKRAERKALLAEKKATPIWNILKIKQLSAQIAGLTELLEELRSEKAVILAELRCLNDGELADLQKEAAKVEANLKRLDEQETNYANHLESALEQYAVLLEQSAAFDPVELYEVRMSLRPEKEKDAVRRAREAYGKQYAPLTMAESKRDVASLLNEEAEAAAVREALAQRRQAHEQATEQRKWVRSQR